MTGNQSLNSGALIIGDADKNTKITTLDQAKKFVDPRCQEIRNAKASKINVQGSGNVIDVNGATTVTILLL